MLAKLPKKRSVCLSSLFDMLGFPLLKSEYIGDKPNEAKTKLSGFRSDVEVINVHTLAVTLIS